MERLLLRLLLGLLKLVFQLVLFVATGSWVKFEKRAPAKPTPDLPPDPTIPTRSQRRRARREQTGRVARAAVFTPKTKSLSAPTTDAPWPFEFAAELSDPEPYAEEGRLNDAERASLAARRARAKLNVPPLTSVREPKRSLTNALRDRRTVRDALVLGAALGARGPRRPRY